MSTLPQNPKSLSFKKSYDYSITGQQGTCNKNWTADPPLNLGV